jgi:hypothetical protein
MKGSLKTALIAAVVSALVAAGAAMATTQTFMLGTTNTVNAKSVVTNGTNTINDKLMQFTNTSTGSGATALGLNVASGHAPLAVSSGAGKAVNLNTDKLDGLDSTAFVLGRGHFLSNRTTVTHVVEPGASASGTILTIPGFGVVSGYCAGMFSGGEGGAYQFAFTNSSGGALDLAFGGEPTPTFPSSSNGYAFVSYAGTYGDVVLADGSTQVLAAPTGVPSSGSSLSPDFDGDGRFWIEAGRDTGGVHRIFDVSIIVHVEPSTPTCVFSAIGATHP